MFHPPQVEEGLKILVREAVPQEFVEALQDYMDRAAAAVSPGFVLRLLPLHPQVRVEERLSILVRDSL